MLRLFLGLPPGKRSVYLGLSRLSSEGQLSLGFTQFPPRTRRQLAQFESANPHAEQPQGRMAKRGRHAPDLAIFPFDQLQSNPAGRHCLAEADRRVARRNLRLRLQPPGTAWQCPASLDYYPPAEVAQDFVRRNTFYLRPILAFMRLCWMEQALV